METVFKAWVASRKLCLDLFDNYSLDLLNKIPDGFSNNIVWNIGHIIVTQQKLIYKGAHLQGYVLDELFDK